MHLFGSSHPIKNAHTALLSTGLITHKETKRLDILKSFLFFASASDLQRIFIATGSPERALRPSAKCVSEMRQYAHKVVTKAIQ